MLAHLRTEAYPVYQRHQYPPHASTELTYEHNNSLIDEAKRKLASKNCDMIVANLVSQEGIGFESDQNEVTLVMRTGEIVPIEKASKRDIADRILDQVLKLRLALHATR